MYKNTHASKTVKLCKKKKNVMNKCNNNCERTIKSQFPYEQYYYKF